jgi:hypothetical protein
LQFGCVGGNVNLQIGQELNQYVLNRSGSTMLNGQIVRITGAQGQRPVVALAQADTKAHCIGTIGMLTENINNNQQGFVTTYGIVHDVNTGSFADGDTLYLSASTPGGYTNVQPTSPNQVVIIGYVIRAHATVGQILIDITGASDLSDLSDVQITTPTTGQVLAYNGGYWVNTATTAALSMPSLTLTSSGDALTLSNKGAIRGDFTTSLVTGTRSYFQTTTANSRTAVSAIPNGTTTATTGFSSYNSSAPANSAFSFIGIDTTTMWVQSGVNGAGTQLPMGFYIGSTPAITISTASVATFANTIVGSVNGNAATATTLATSRNIWGQSFNGSADVTGNLTSVGDITGSAGITIATSSNGNITLSPNGTGVANYGSYEVGWKIMPQNSQSAAYTTVLSDSSKQIFHPSADTTARTFTIDSNANVPYPIGTTISFINQNGAGTLTIAITSDTMRLAGAGTTGNRTLAANGIATAVKIATTEWIISGVGLT